MSSPNPVAATDQRQRSSFVDASTFCGHWPFRDLAVRTPAALKAHLREQGVTRAWAAPIEAILLPDPMQANMRFLVAAAGDPFFVPVAIVDPTLPSWARDAQHCLDAGARAIKLTPNYHEYALGEDRAAAIASWAEAAGVTLCVQLRVMDERAHHPLMKVPGVAAADVAAFGRRHPHLRILACGAYYGELKALKAADNVSVEISFVEFAHTLPAAAAILGWRRLLFGSHSPLHYFEASRIKLDVDPQRGSPADLAGVARENAAAWLS